MPSSTLFQRFESKVEEVKADRQLLDKIYEAFSKGLPADVSHYSIRRILVEYEDIEDFIYNTKKRLKNNGFTGSYALIGEFGTGKTQYGLFLKNALQGEDLIVEYLPLRRIEDLDRLRESIEELSKKSSVVVILDNIDNLLDDKGLVGKVASKLANIVQSFTEVPVNGHGVSLIFLMHTNSYRTLEEEDERLRRIAALKDLGKLRDSKVASELALSVLAVLSAHDEDVVRSIRMCGERLIELLTKWGESILEVKGKMGKGLFIKKCFRLFKEILENLNRCPQEGVKRGEMIEEFVINLLKDESIHFTVEGRPFSVKAERKYSAIGAPDLTFHVFKGEAPIGAAIMNVFCEIKAVSRAQTLKQYEKQFEKYAAENPLLILVFTSETAKAEDILTEMGFDERKFLIYPLELIEPLTLAVGGDLREVLRLTVGKDLVDDIEWMLSALVRELLASKPKPPPVVDPKALAMEIVSRAKLRDSRAKRVQVGGVANKIEGILRSNGLQVDAEEFAMEVMRELVSHGYLERYSKSSKKQFRVVPDEWRRNFEGALDIIANIIKSVSGST